jgi:hypothetical protein
MYLVPISRFQRVEKRFRFSSHFLVSAFGELAGELAPFSSELLDFLGDDLLSRFNRL